MDSEEPRQAADEVARSISSASGHALSGSICLRFFLCDSLTGRARRPPGRESLASVRLAETHIRLCDEARPYQKHDLDLTTPTGGIRFSLERHRLYTDEVCIAEGGTTQCPKKKAATQRETPSGLCSRDCVYGVGQDVIGCTRRFRVHSAKACLSDAVYSKIDSARVACATASGVVCKWKYKYVSLLYFGRCASVIR